MLVLIKGAGDLATGTAIRLHRAGMQVVMTDLENPTAVRRTVSFSQCMYDGAAVVEGIEARRACPDEVLPLLRAGHIPVLPDPEAAILRALPFDALVDAVMAKRNTGTSLGDAPRVVALGPGFTAGRDCHAVVETMRGHDLGRVITRGCALPDTGIPGEVGGHTSLRLLRAPCAGVFSPVLAIGDTVQPGDLVAYVDKAPLRAGIGGIVRGLLPAGLGVYAGMKAGDIDPRCEKGHCFTVSDKARAVAGGVMEGLLLCTV